LSKARSELITISYTKQTLQVICQQYNNTNQHYVRSLITVLVYKVTTMTGLHGPNSVGFESFLLSLYVTCMAFSCYIQLMHNIVLLYRYF